MKSTQQPLNIGADIAKDEIVVACAEQSFSPHKIANSRSALLAWLKSCPKAAASQWSPPAATTSCWLNWPTSWA